MKATAQTIIIWLFLLFVAGESIHLYLDAKADSRRLLFDLKAAQDTARVFRTRDGEKAVKLIAQELTIRELKTVNPGLIAQLKNLYIPPRLVNSYTQTGQTFQATVSTPVIHETAAPVPATIDTTAPVPEREAVEGATSFNFSDKWLIINGRILNDSAKINVSATDTILTVIHKGERRRPWLWIFSKRQYTATATNKSPYININVIQAGVIKQ
jgi:hypothetical protein